MPTAEKKFVLRRGTAPTLRFGPVTDVDGAVVDVSGWTTVFVMRGKTYDPDPVVFSKEGSILGASADGLLIVPLTAEETLGFEAGTYAYGFERTNVGFEDLLTTGQVTVKYDVVHAIGET